MKNLLYIFVLLFFSFSACQQKEKKISYNDHIRPILNKKCLPCHGGVKAEAGFSLLFREDAMGEMDSGKKAIVPGNHKKSELYQRLISTDPESRMPQEAAPLLKEEIDLIATWIDEGAAWEDHWAYIPPELPELPPIESDWIKNNIDYFVLNRLQKEGFVPALTADKNTLLRRVSFDLIGLPPNEEQMDKFLNNSSTNTYEQLVDELLDSQHFGERWAAMWLDLSRYADSKGYEKDPHRNIWRYREWVINAFNRDLPFDQFTIEQLAGDLLDQPTQDQLIATAFHRNSMTNTEGGTDDEEFRVTAVLDRLNTTFDVWQGTTIGCVQCHSHPYDPIRHEEFYELSAIFNNTKDADLDGEIPNLELYQEGPTQEVEKVIDFIQALDANKTIQKEAPLATRIKEALFPTLLPIHCDDFLNIEFRGNGASNWARNLLMGKNRKYYFKFDKIDLTGLTAISYTYSTDGDDARLELRLDSLGGPLVQTIDFESTKEVKNEKGKRINKIQKLPIDAITGQHSLFFELLNTTDEIPDGNVVVGEIELHYENKYQAIAKLEEHKKELIQLRKKADYTPIMQAKSVDFQRETNVFERGNFSTKGEVVQPGVPRIFPAMNQEDPDRLAFAKWLVNEKNPLTARVIVNRFWEQIFGTGIVETVEDFGTQGFKPTHPELLDYLAMRFMQEHQWSVKALLKEILMSATYQQSSKTIATKTEKDPYNQLLSRGARFRLSAEQIRDQALAVSGLLFDTIGGESVMPVQPDGIWQVVYSGMDWKTATDRNKYRRGLYTYWRRTTPYPSMTTFDSPSREFCVSRRIRTNTPLQALVTLNDPVFLEAAESLSTKMKKKGDQNLIQSIIAGYRLALAKEPDTETIQILSNLYYQAEQQLEPRTISVAQQESGDFEIKDPMTVVANAIMNLDAFMMKE